MNLKRLSEKKKNKKKKQKKKKKKTWTIDFLNTTHTERIIDLFDTFID